MASVVCDRIKEIVEPTTETSAHRLLDFHLREIEKQMARSAHANVFKSFVLKQVHPTRTSEASNEADK